MGLRYSRSTSSRVSIDPAHGVLGHELGCVGVALGKRSGVLRAAVQHGSVVVGRVAGVEDDFADELPKHWAPLGF